MPRGTTGGSTVESSDRQDAPTRESAAYKLAEAGPNAFSTWAPLQNHATDTRETPAVRFASAFALARLKALSANQMVPLLLERCSEAAEPCVPKLPLAMNSVGNDAIPLIADAYRQGSISQLIMRRSLSGIGTPEATAVLNQIRQDDHVVREQEKSFRTNTSPSVGYDTTAPGWTKHVNDSPK